MWWCMMKLFFLQPPPPLPPLLLSFQLNPMQPMSLTQWPSLLSLPLIMWLMLSTPLPHDTCTFSGLNKHILLTAAYILWLSFLYIMCSFHTWQCTDMEKQVYSTLARKGKYMVARKKIKRTKPHPLHQHKHQTLTKSHIHAPLHSTHTQAPTYAGTHMHIYTHTITCTYV